MEDYKGEIIMKEIKLKNGEILTIFCPILDDAQELADTKLILMQKDL